MAWSIFSDGGGNGAALTWAKNLLSALGAPDTPADEQFIYDWEKSEGGGGKYNPLNQGPVPGKPGLTTTGSQYGGGAADYASYAAGIQGAVDYLNMSNYTAVKSDLMAGNASAAKAALIASPWAASHYGGGSAFSNAPIPGQATSLLGGSTGVNAQTADAATAQNAGFSIPGFIGGLLGLGGLGIPDTVGSMVGDLKNIFVRLGLIVFGGVLVIIGVVKLFELEEKAASKVGTVAGVAMGNPEAVAGAVEGEKKAKESKDAAEPEG